MNEAKTDSVFRQQVRMASVQVSGLRPDELAQALAYEVEPLSGIPAPEAEVTYQPVVDADPTVRVYEVTVRRRARQGGRSGGLERWLRPAVVFAALVVLSVLGDGVRLAVRRASLERTVRERRPLQAELDRLQAETRTCRGTAAELRGRREAAAQAQEETARRRAALAQVLDVLAEACGGGTVLQSIASGEDSRSLRIRAIGVSGEAAARTMQALSERLTGFGWRLVPGEIVASDTGATVAFSFGLTGAR